MQMNSVRTTADSELPSSSTVAQYTEALRRRRSSRLLSAWVQAETSHATLPLGSGGGGGVTSATASTRGSSAGLGDDGSSHRRHRHNSGNSNNNHHSYNHTIAALDRVGERADSDYAHDNNNNNTHGGGVDEDDDGKGDDVESADPRLAAVCIEPVYVDLPSNDMQLIVRAALLAYRTHVLAPTRNTWRKEEGARRELERDVERTAMRELCHDIKAAVEAQLGGCWHVLYGRDYASYVTHKVRSFCQFKLDGADVTVWRHGG